MSLSPNGAGTYTWYNPGLFWESAAPAANITSSSSGVTLTWTSGQSTSDTSIATAAKDGSHYQAWRYGYFEASLKWDPVVGSWPAFWMLPAQAITCGSCEQGELDIFEGQGDTPHTFYGTIHDWVGSSDVQSNSNNNAYDLSSSVDMSQYHTYGVLWTAGSVAWYFDNQKVLSASTPAIFDAQDYYLILGSQEGQNWSYGDKSGVTATSLPMSVQWVRVWQQ